MIKAMQENHTCLVIKDRPTDYVLGSSSPIQFRAVNSGDWLPYTEFFERQMISDGDTNGCVLFSSQEAFDAQIENLIQLGEIPAPTLQFFHDLGYMDTGADGKPHFHTSPRFLQVLTGNGFNGNSVQDAWDVMRHYGALPWKDMPVTPDLTLENYLTPPTQAQLDKAKQFLVAIGGKDAIQYHWIVNGGATNVPAMTKALAQSPLCIGINIGSNWNTVKPSAPPAGSPPGHCVMNYMVDTHNDAFVYDHYLPNPKELLNGYPIQYVIQAVVTITPPPPAPTLPANVTPQTATPWQIQQFIIDALAWLQNIANRLSGVKVGSTASTQIMTPAILGFLRGAGYSAIGGAIAGVIWFLSTQPFWAVLGGLGITGIVAAWEHSHNIPTFTTTPQ